MYKRQGNGRATSGDFKLRFATDDGFSLDWNRTIDVLSAAIPSLAFHQVVLADGTTSPTPLGVGAHPVGTGFDLAWEVENEGTSTWRPITSIIVPNDDNWEANCPITPSSLAAGASSIIWCTVTIPVSEQAGSEPVVTLRMEGEGVVVENSISLLVDSVAAVVWDLRTESFAHEGYPVQMTIDIQNIGNSQINHRLDVNAPDDWGVFIDDELLVILSPGESRSIVIEFTPASGSDGTIQLALRNGELIQDSTFSFEVDVMPARGESNNMASTLIPILIILLIAILAGGGFYVFQQKGGKLESIMANEAVSKITDSLNITEKESGSGIECWVCSGDIIVGEALACGSCGARYHRPGQVGGCDILSLGKCLHCNADWNELVDA